MSEPEMVTVEGAALARVCWLLKVESWQNSDEGTQGPPKSGRPSSTYTWLPTRIPRGMAYLAGFVIHHALIDEHEAA